MLTNAKRLYKLAEYTVECRKDGWYFGRSARFGDKEEMRGPYKSIASVRATSALRLTTTMEISPQDLDRDGILTRATSGPGVADRISSSRKNLRASLGLEANDKLIIVHPIGIASSSDRSSV
jgi:hypothetical protein